MFSRSSLEISSEIDWLMELDIDSLMDATVLMLCEIELLIEADIDWLVLIMAHWLRDIDWLILAEIELDID